MTPEYMAEARSLFERALVLDPSNIEALVGTALVDVSSVHLTDYRAAPMAEAEAVLIKALSIAPQHASAHMLLVSKCIRTARPVALLIVSGRWSWIEIWPMRMGSSALLSII
jgi:cytochrome c-type biogenesis protein CcmH/NrfG